MSTQDVSWFNVIDNFSRNAKLYLAFASTVGGVIPGEYCFRDMDRFVQPLSSSSGCELCNDRPHDIAPISRPWAPFLTGLYEPKLSLI